MRRPALVLVLAIVSSACSEAFIPQPIPPPELPTSPPPPSEGPEFVELPDTPVRPQAPNTQPPLGPEVPTADSAIWLALVFGVETDEVRFARAFAATFAPVPDRGPTLHSSSAVAPRAPSAETRIVAQSATQVRVDRGMSQRATTCGPAAGYLVVCPPDPDPGKFTDYYVMTMRLEAPLPPKASPGIYTYAFVLDVDGKPENNFKPEPAFPNDFYKDTDTWYEIVKAANGEFLLEIWLQSLGAPQKRSGARALIKDDALMLVVPAPELASVPAGYRMTTFKHSGDFGMQGDWSGDTSPRVGQPLRPFVAIRF